jgi:predicted alpha/beta-hydrolase family hydrolase
MTEELQRQGGAIHGRIVLAHGAGAGMDSRFMQFFAAHLANNGLETILFNFPYMQKRSEDGKKRPPDRAPKLMDHFRDVLEGINRDAPLFIGGKSMGGRMASMLLAEDGALADGLLLLGYPFHPPGKAEKLRTGHFAEINVPTHIFQGERDTFGGRPFVERLSLPKNFHLHWVNDGDHGFKPRKKSGFTEEGNWATTVTAISDVCKNYSV